MQLDTSIVGGKTPTHGGGESIATQLPSGDLFDEGRLVRDTSSETLSMQDTEFNSAMLSQLPCLGV